MLEQSNALPSERLSPSTLVAVVIAVLGSVFYLLFALDILLTNRVAPYWGMNIYNYQTIAILNGTLEMPARILGYEGHYAPDGTAVSYHGVAPVLTRLLMAPFVPLDNPALSSVAIWFWSTLGAVFYHLSFHQVAARFWPEESPQRTLWFGVLALMVWVSSPSIMMVVAVPFYHEPIALAYAMGGIFVFCLMRYHFFGTPASKILIPMAICAALTVHARPNLAVGLLLGTGILCALTLLGRERWRSLLSIGVAGAIMGAGLAGYIALNNLKFGSAGKVHGSYEATDVQYGTVYWLLEEPDSPRAQAFIDHGRFNVKRIVPNLMFYTFVPPRHALGMYPYRKALIAYRKVTEPMLGFIRISLRTAGVFFLWTGWFALVFFAFRRKGLWAPGPAALLLGTGASAVLTLSYGTVSLRYAFDMWPLLAALGLMSLPVAARALAQKSLHKGVLLCGCAAVAVGLVGSAYNASIFSGRYQTPFGQEWTYEECAERVTAKGLPAERLEAICAL